VSAISDLCVPTTTQSHAQLLDTSVLLVRIVQCSALVDITRLPLVKPCALSASPANTACQDPLQHALRATTVLEDY